MAKTFRPKEVLKEAELAEKSGNGRVASKLYHTLALHLSKKAKWAEAYQILAKAIKHSKKSARLYVHQALITDQLQQPEDALSAVKSFVSLSLEKGKLSEYVAYMEDQLKNFPKLRKLFFEELLKLERTTSFPFIGLAKTCLEIGEGERAKHLLVDALRTKDQTEKVISLLYETLKGLGQESATAFVEKFERGELTLEELETLLTDKKETKISVSVSDWEGEKDLKGLISELERELGIDVEIDLDSVKPLVSEFRKRADQILGKDGKARIDMAMAFYEMGLYQDAGEELGNISASDPSILEALCLQGRIHVAQGSDLKALSTFQSVLRQGEMGDEPTKDALYQMVEIYSRINDWKKALEIAKQLEKLDPNYREIHRLRINLEEQEKR